MCKPSYTVPSGCDIDDGIKIDECPAYGAVDWQQENIYI